MIKLSIKSLRTSTGMTQQAFAEYFGFSRRAVQEWEGGRRECPAYLVSLVEYKLRQEGLLSNPEYVSDTLQFAVQK